MDPKREGIIPYLNGEKGKVNTEVCEEAFSWLQAYKNSSRQMTEARFKWFVLRMCEMRNKWTYQQLQKKGKHPRTRPPSDIGLLNDLNDPLPPIFYKPRKMAVSG